MTTPAANPHASTAQLVVHFVRSIEEVLSTMVGVTVTIGQPAINSTINPPHDVSGIIGFSGAFVGCMVLAFNYQTASALVGAFAGAPVDPSSPDFPDAVGELANMIAGSAKKAFDGESSITVPCVVTGHGHSVARVQGAVSVLIPCQTRLGNFACEVCLKPAGDYHHSVKRTQ